MNSKTSETFEPSQKLYNELHDVSRIVCDTKRESQEWLDSALLLIQAEFAITLEAAKVETAKAYGACTKCYGKGYATYTEYAAAKGKKWPISGPMHFCTCDRGKQLGSMVEAAKREARIVGAELLAKKIYGHVPLFHTPDKCKLCAVVDGHLIILRSELSHPNQPKQDGGSNA